MLVICNLIPRSILWPSFQFSFFSSDYAPPGVFADVDIVSPESQLLSMSSVVGITNGFFSLFNFGLNNADGMYLVAVLVLHLYFTSSKLVLLTYYSYIIGGFGPYMSTQRVIGDYSSSVGHLTHQVEGADIAGKIDELATVMTGGRLSIENKQVMIDAYTYFRREHDVETADKVLLGLVTACPEFHTSNLVKKTGNKREVTPPATPTSEPYKAIVYIHLSGGLDSFNLLTPHNESGCYLYDNYFSLRGGSMGVGLAIEDLLPIDGTSAGIDGCDTFGVNKLMSAYKDIYDEGAGIFLANMVRCC